MPTDILPDKDNLFPIAQHGGVNSASFAIEFLRLNEHLYQMSNGLRGNLRLVFVKRNGRWQIVAEQRTGVGKGVGQT